MIELNLIYSKNEPEIKNASAPSVPLLPVCVIAVLAVLSLHGGLLWFVSSGRQRLSGLENRWQILIPEKKVLDSVAAEIRELDAKTAAIQRIARPDISWTGILYGINRAVLPGIWLSGLNIEQLPGPQGQRPAPSVPGGKLIITGYALGKSEVATTIVARFINSLKAENTFFEHFAEIELDNMRGVAIAGEETMFFRLSCLMKSKEAASPRR